MLTKREEDLSQDIFEAEMKIIKARVLLNDLLGDYDFDYEPDKETAQRLSYDAKRVITFIQIINEYIFQIETDMKKAQNRLEDEEYEAN